MQTDKNNLVGSPHNTTDTTNGQATRSPNPIKLDARLARLLREFDFEVCGKAIFSLPIRGFTSRQYFGPCRDIFSAADHLIAIIRDDNYYNRLQQILQG